MTPSTLLLFLNVFVIATCGLVYELLAGTLASYVLGDSVTQFSLVIGVYLSAMGVGAWLSRYVERALAWTFIEVQLALALWGGLSAPVLLFCVAHLSWFQGAMLGVVFGVGTLVGMELPLLIRILESRFNLKELVARVLTVDYLGALVASLLFPLFLVPRLGLVRTSLVFGILNAGVGLWSTWLLRPVIGRSPAPLRIRGAMVVVVLVVGVAYAESLTSLAEEGLFADSIVYSQSTPYQRIVITQGRAGFQLFLNGNLQFSSADEYRYHEALAHPAMAAAASPRSVLVLGGGDGLALREVLKHAGIERVTLVDLDPAMTSLSKSYLPLGELNRHAFDDPRVEVVNADAMIWLESAERNYDVAIVDFPDPNNFALGKLYTLRFYRLLRARLSPGGAVSVQCTSPIFARRSYWCIIRTIEAAGFHASPYQASVPAFGVWGFALARLAPFDPPNTVDVDTRFLNSETLSAMFVLPNDASPLPVEINRLDNQSLVRYYESEWKRWE